MKIAFDLDGVIFDFNTPFLKFYNRRHKTEFCTGNVTCYNYAEIIEKTGISDEKFRKDMNDFYNTLSFRNLPIITGAEKVITNLRKNHFLGCITSRPDSTSGITTNSLNSNFPNIFSEVHFTGYYNGNGKKREKSDVCIQRGYGVMIEDAVKYANDCAEQGIRTILITRPWNIMEKLHPKVERVEELQQLVQLLQ